MATFFFSIEYFFSRKVFTFQKERKMFILQFWVKIYEKYTMPNNMFLLIKRATFIDFLKFSQDYGYSIGYVY